MSRTKRDSFQEAICNRTDAPSPVSKWRSLLSTGIWSDVYDALGCGQNRASVTSFLRCSKKLFIENVSSPSITTHGVKISVPKNCKGPATWPKTPASRRTRQQAIFGDVKAHTSHHPSWLRCSFTCIARFYATVLQCFDTI
jgi:hypothetical protein